MVIHNDEAPTEVSTLMQSKFDANSYICASEIKKISQKESKMSSRSRVTDVSDDTLKRKARKLKKKPKKTNQSSASLSSTDYDDDSSSTTEISIKDILQLRTAYKQCKLVMRKMELKYSHLLESDSSDSTGEPRVKRSRPDNAPVIKSECQCTLNKKILFDDDGKEVTSDILPVSHICSNKIFMTNHIEVKNNQNSNIEIEHSDRHTDLSDDLQELRHILQDPSIEMTYRNRVIEKLKLIKQEHWNEIKMNKPALIERLKICPNEVCSFKGANLSVLKGYHYNIQ